MSTNMPSQLNNLLQNPALMRYTRKFSDLFTQLPQDLSTLFSNCLASTLDIVWTTLPPALTSPLPENLALSLVFRIPFIQFRSLLIIMLGTVITTVRLFVHTNDVSILVSKFLTVMNTGLYGNPSLDLPSLLNSLHNTMTNAHDVMSQPYSALTNFPYEVFSMLNNTLPSVLHPLPLELQNHHHLLLVTINTALDTSLRNVHEQFRLHLNNNPAAPDYHLQRLTVQYVYQTREDAKTDPDKCSVCLTDMKPGDNARRLSCSHFFHLQCIDRWLETKPTCPLCRTPIDASHD